MDEGIMDFSGYVSIMTRTDDVINVAGHRLSTKAIEEVCTLFLAYITITFEVPTRKLFVALTNRSSCI